ncbi:MAG: FAD assembly factor SdhE [Plesiomonas sp.]|uniref:FAD assembly factor SdhE n=1 Tax=Plesiomonas sp. TaxID=2486279 RepID=UPI003F2CDF79
MDINDKARVRWACRRGMLELDVIIMPFFEHEYDTLTDVQKVDFIRLLESDDPDLFRWFMNSTKPTDPVLDAMVVLMKTRNQARGFMAV